MTEVENVQVSANSKIISVQNVCRSLKRVCTLNDLSRLLATFSHVQICNGIKLLDVSLTHHKLSQDIFGDWRHTSCSIVSSSQICSLCQKFKKLINENKRRALNQSIKKRNNYSYKKINEKSKIILLHKQLRS